MEVHPPSITSDWPVMCPELGESKNNAAFAISSTRAGLPMGVMRDQVSS